MGELCKLSASQPVSIPGKSTEVLTCCFSERFILSEKVSKRLSYGHIVCREPSGFFILPKVCKSLMCYCEQVGRGSGQLRQRRHNSLFGKGRIYRKPVNRVFVAA